MPVDYDALAARYRGTAVESTPPVDDPAFRQWYAGMAQRYDLGPDPDAPEQFYDYRAAFKAGASPDASGHWPSDFKKPGHPNMVVGGFNVQTGERVPGAPRAKDAAELVRLGWDPQTAAKLAATPEADVDYDALARQHGAIDADAPAMPAGATAGMLPPSAPRTEPRHRLTGVPGILSGIGVGVGRSIAGAGRAIEGVTGMNLPDLPIEEQAATPSEQVGAFAERVGEYAIPAGMIGRSMAAAPMALRALAQGSAAGAVGTAQGGDVRSGIVPALLAGGATMVPGVIEGGRRLAGVSSTRAAANIQAATKAATGAVVDTQAPGRAGLRAMELQAAGGSMPRAATQFMRRITDPKAADLTFEEARDFYSNLSRMSSNDFGRLNPVMQRQIGEMRAALHEALVASAESVGAGQQYASGIKEYAKAAHAAQQWDAAKPALMRTLRRLGGFVAGGAGAGAAYKWATGD